MVEHADAFERELEQHAPELEAVSIGLTDDAYLRSFTWARLELGLPLPPDRES